VGKNPAIQFYVGDWIQDTRSLSLAAKGAWIDMLCLMWRSQTRGKLTDDMVGWARVIGASVEQTEAVIAELVEKRICDTVTERNKKVTLICRRMYRDYKEKQYHAVRQQRYRNKNPDDGESDSHVTPPSSKDSKDTKDSYSKRIKNICGLKPETASEFENFWNLYPKRNGKKLLKGEAVKAFGRLSKVDQAEVFLAVKNYNSSKLVSEGVGIRDAVRFLKKDYWKEWLEPEKNIFKGEQIFNQGHVRYVKPDWMKDE